MSGPRRPAAGDGDDGAAGSLEDSPAGATPEEVPPAEVTPGEVTPGEVAEAEADAYADVRLGELLREARRDRAMTLAEVESDTRINRDYIEALEQERFELLPAPVYARGFLRAYARHLGLDEDATLALLPADLPSPPGLEPIAGMMRGPRALLPAINLPVAGAVVAAVAVVVLFVLANTLFGGDDEGDTGGAAGEAGPQPAATVTAATTAPSDGRPRSAATVPPFEVGETPDFIGVDRETAQALLTQLGLAFVVIEVERADTGAGEVFAQSPEPGEPIGPDDDVTLVVSRGGEG
ncbi:MAG: helix-turn-helix domain-containing protein [Dehalococcoidia bacterium]